MKIILIPVIFIAIIAYIYGNHLRKKKKQMIPRIPTAETITIQRFTIEEMLKWFKSHDDIVDGDEYLLTRSEASGEKDNSVTMLILDSSHTIVKHARKVIYLEVEKEILDILGDRNLVILD